MLLRSATCITFILLVFGFKANAQVQDDERPQFKFGAKAGVNFSWFTNDVDLMDQPSQRYAGFRDYPRIGLNIGLTADRQLSEKIMFGAELLYSGRGTNYREENTNMGVWYDDNGNEQRSYNYLTYKFDYMELPLHVGYNFLPERSNTFLLGYVGVAPTLLINHKRRINYDQNATDLQDQKYDMRYGKGVITNITGGVRVMERKIFGVTGGADLRGSYTLSPVFTRNYTDAGRNLDTRMFTVSLGLNIRF